MVIQTITDTYSLLSDLDGVKEHMYLLMDGARFDNIHRFLYEHEDFPDYTALYKGTNYETCKEVSPCIAKVPNPSCTLLKWYVERGADEDKAVILVSKLGTDELAEYYQQFLEAQLPDGKTVLFRFYDPTVLCVLITKPQHSVTKRILEPLTTLYWKEDGFFKKFDTGQSEVVDDDRA